MSEKNLRRRVIPITDRRFRSPRHPSPLPHCRTGVPPTRRSSTKPTSKSVRVPNRCSSEPALRTASGDEHWCSESDGLFYRQQTYTDIFSCPPILSQSPKTHQLYKKEAKVVVNVTVEGSPGPIRAMVKLGSSVEETIRLVVNKYDEEGRSPKLDRNATKSFQLHSSYFSLDGLNKSDEIGDVGSRSFYLRKISQQEELKLAHDSSSSSLHPFFLFTAFIEHRIGKFMRRMRKLWTVLGCMQCG